MCVCVCACVCVCVCVCTCVCMYVCWGGQEYDCVLLNGGLSRLSSLEYVCLFLCVGVCMDGWARGCLFVFVRVCLCVSGCLCERVREQNTGR